ncbi:hypothetical protein NIIDMKKI_49570 [Mycobacterium kansasii]|uniref:Lantibiotic biosynthesis protein dehydration domain-containing protein n=1 Tax=Mycobacterium kansasii TaxID=1768 RepID=A0A7G1IFD0_MYCKA|nr:hypothetical protein NIIDMKKI_49570 [Mycobacterium kansasii]
MTWQHINTDGLGYRYGRVKAKQGDNLPRFEEQYLSPDSNVEEIVDGFQSVYRLLTSHREQLLAPDSPFREIFTYPARFILRSTMHYMSVLNSACHPDCLREGIDFDIQLDVLSRPFLHDKRRLELWPLVREEVAACWRTDVPKFTARGDSDSLVLPSGETAQACFTDSAFNQSQQNLSHFGEDDLCWQVKLIRGRWMRAMQEDSSGMPRPPSTTTSRWSRWTGRNWWTRRSRWDAVWNAPQFAKPMASRDGWFSRAYLRVTNSLCGQWNWNSTTAGAG